MALMKLSILIYIILAKSAPSKNEMGLETNL